MTNAPESPEIHNHHLRVPDITGTVSVTVSDRDLQGELSPPLHCYGRLKGSKEEGREGEGRSAPLHSLKVIHLMMHAEINVKLN